MKLFTLLVFILFLQAVHAQSSYLISGKIYDSTSTNGLDGATVRVKGAKSATATQEDGSFQLKISQKLPITLLVSYNGYTDQEFTVSSETSPIAIALKTEDIYANQVVVTASRVAESILKSPVAIEKLSLTTLQQAPAPSFYDAMENIKGLQMTTSSLTFKVPNTRGFNIPNNFRFMQLVDGVDMQAATLGVPLGNAIGPTELDIENVEVTPGAASALYGMNAINGMANLLTKSPFKYQGISVYQRTGVNHVDGIDAPPSILTESAVRFAKAWNNKFAFKMNVSYMQGTDWRSNTRLDQNTNNLPSANPKFSSLNSNNNVAYDGWNKYGDDALAGSNLSSIGGLTIDGKAAQSLRVVRTGYWETDLVDPQVKNAKFDASLHYKPTEKTELLYSYRVGEMDGVFQRGNKVALHNVVVQNHKLEWKGSNFLVRGYVSIENTGNSYNLKPLADNLDLRSGGSSTIWAAKYKTALLQYADKNGGLTSNNLAAANAYARQQADAGRAQLGTAYFNALKDSIIGINNWDIKSSQIPNAPPTGGAALWQRSRLYHVEGQWDISSAVKYFNVLVGADARVYQVIPDGNNFVDFSRPASERNKVDSATGNFGHDLYYKKFGGFVQASKTFFDEKLKLWASLRGDYDRYFTAKFTPRVSAVYTVAKRHNFRVTFQQGYRFPSLFEALSFVNNGRVRRVGSLPFINQGLGYLENSYYQTSVIKFNSVVSAAGNSDSAALANRSLLQKADLPDARPEKITSFEVGYKSVLFDNKLVINIDAYTNTYNGFLGQVQVYVPHGETLGSDAAILAMLDRNRDPVAAQSATVTSPPTAASNGQNRYRVYTNAKSNYINYGSSIGINYNFYKTYIVAGNASFNKLKSQNANDIFVTGFNTPDWATSLSFGNRAAAKNIGYNAVWRWQNSFNWQSPLVNGNIVSYSTFDAQVTFRAPKINTVFKAGGSDLFNHRYIQYAGGPTIGAIYYLAITYDLGFNK
ncbi:MAG: TonB-dependent receptor [Bacteroidota bacterium]|nr:TonB-dependent receptor [Bacteroidota bacterium]